MIRIGTSGWAYDDWQGIFYPEDLLQDEHLPFYAEFFGTVEINNTFYNLPSEGAVEAWRERVPEGFVFATKASRYITHVKNLLDPEKPVQQFLERVELLGQKLGPILFQLPPSWNVNAERIRGFISILPQGHRYAFEFRDDSWYTEEVFEILEDSGCAFCIHDHEDAPSPERITAGFSYIRFHGSDGSYEGKYEQESLAGWAEKLATWAKDGLDLYCYFNNDYHGYALDNVSQLKQLIGENGYTWMGLGA
jgi:uncharacterized protein YecE (DUF72 family)